MWWLLAMLFFCCRSVIKLLQQLWVGKHVAICFVQNSIVNIWHQEGNIQDEVKQYALLHPVEYHLHHESGFRNQYLFSNVPVRASSATVGPGWSKGNGLLQLANIFGQMLWLSAEANLTLLIFFVKMRNDSFVLLQENMFGFTCNIIKLSSREPKENVMGEENAIKSLPEKMIVHSLELMKASICTWS